MASILFVNDSPVALVVGTEDFCQKTLEQRQKEHFNSTRARSETFEYYKTHVHWHYHDVPTVTGA